MNAIVSDLFKTNAIKICPENKPFWYTSGKIGPYFINTHFLFGSENDATTFLSYIDTLLSNKEELPKKVFEKVLKQYNENELYHRVIDTMKDFISKNINLDEISYISGGERRDWFFSDILSYLLQKPHITIYKDLSCLVSSYDFSTTEKVENLNGKKVLHIADLITEASSYIRAWIPAIKNIGGEITSSLVVVDRMQGGSNRLKEANINSYSLVKIDESLFQSAKELNIINDNQYSMLCRFYENPDETMKEFIKKHPEFLQDALASDEKTAKRARLCIESKFYE